MVDWSDPEVQLKAGRSRILEYHVLFGIYVWEYLTSLWYDWAIIRGKRKLSIGIGFYLATRYCCLFGLIMIIGNLTVYHADTNCRGYRFAIMSFTYSAVCFSSGLLYMRVVALSKKNKWIIWGLGAGYLGAWGLTAESVRHNQAVYNPQLFVCAGENLQGLLPVNGYLFGYDLVCLAFIGLFLWRMDYHGTGLWPYLCGQGIVYFVVITFSYLILTVIFVVDDTEAIARMAHGINLILVVLCATRMQRGLDDYVRNRPLSGSLAGSAPTPLPSWNAKAVPWKSVTSTERSMHGTILQINVQTDMVTHADTESTPRIGSVDNLSITSSSGSTAVEKRDHPPNAYTSPV